MELIFVAVGARSGPFSDPEPAVVSEQRSADRRQQVQVTPHSIGCYYYVIRLSAHYSCRAGDKMCVRINDGDRRRAAWRNR